MLNRRLNRREVLTLGLAGLALRPAAALEVVEAGPARALHALNRLGFGPAPGDLAALSNEAGLQQFLTAQLAPQTLVLPAALQTRLGDMSTAKLGQAELLGVYRQLSQAGREAKRASKSLPEGNQARRDFVRPVVLEASSQRLLRALQSPAQLEEVLVDFWFNHFNVFVGKGPVSVLVGSYEREAIRPHVLGKFRSMLGAVAKHPAMLIYLDNVQSVAPGLAAAGGKLRGLNENYARELMELHTLGVDAGYAQRDVTELARMLTGWTIDDRAGQAKSSASLFQFEPRRHDKGLKQWLGRQIANRGQDEGEMALDVLAAHPATARHLAYKLAQAFVADEPPPALVLRLQQRYLSSQGDLRALMLSLIDSAEFWQAEASGAKYKTPYQYLLSAMRALGQQNPPALQPLLSWLAQAGQPLYGAQTPDGYKHVAAAWLNPEGLAQRVQLASTLAGRYAGTADLPSLLPALSPAALQSIATEPAALRLALGLSSPDFMRR